MLMHALAAICEEVRARTGNPPLDGNPSSNMNSANQVWKWDLQPM